MKLSFRHLLISLLIMLASSMSTAQLMPFQQGKNYFLDGDFTRALDYFNQAISQERSGNAELLTEAYYLRGLTYVRLYNEAISGADKEKQQKYSDALLSAYNDFIASLTYDKGLYWQSIDTEMKNLHQPLLQEGLKSLNEYNDLVYNGKTEQKLLIRAEEYLVAAHEIRDSYLVNDLLGQVALDKGNQVDAEKFFTRAEKLYTEYLPEEPDFLMAYVFYRLAAIHKASDLRAALDDARRGVSLMESEYERFSALKFNLSPVRIMQLEDQYTLAMQDLTHLKLDLYMNSPGMYAEALATFEEELAKKPGDLELLTGYASLLEKADRPKAMITYENILALQPENQLALFNLGVLHYGRGKEMFDLAQKTSDNDLFSQLLDEATLSFETAKPYFEKVLEIDPNSLDAIQALKIIAFVLDDKEDYLKYQSLEKENAR